MKKLIFLPIFLYQTFGLYAQQSEHAFLDAYAEKGEQEFFYRNSRVSSGSYIYVAGASINDDGDYDMLLTKYSGTTEIWSVVWDGGVEGDDYAADVIIDGTGNIIICGTSEVSATNYNAVVVKYNSSGALQWVSSFAGGANLYDGFVSLERDNSNNIYACGATQSATEFSNYLVTKYNSSGTQQWASTYDYNDLNDAAVKLVITSTYILVSGGTQVDATDWQMTSVKYSPSTGAQGSVLHTGGDNEGIDEVKDVWTDGTYTYIVGGVDNMLTGLDWKLMKLNSDLEVVWSATYNGSASEDDMIENVKVDGSGNVYVTGWATVTGEGKNYVTRKYNSSGTVQWTNTFNESSENADDQALSLEFDGAGNIIVTGSSYKDGNKDFLTVKYKYTDGAEVWKSRFNSDYNDDDIPSNIAINIAGDIYVIGTVGKGDGTTTYQLCQYKVQTVYMPVPEDGFNPTGYVKNRGQLRSTNGSTSTGVKFYNSGCSPAIYINDSCHTFLLAQLDSAAMDSIHRIDMKFNKGNTNSKTFGINEKENYVNYYLGYMDQQAPRTPYYDAIIKLNAYSNTDIIFTSNSKGYRNWIVARSGAPTADFEMEYNGQTFLSINSEGALLIGNSLDTLVQPKAIAYSMNNTSGHLTQLEWEPEYVISDGNKVSFTNIGSWSGTLVIEMQKGTIGGGGFPAINNLEWCTYLGGGAGDQYLSVHVWNDFQYACGSSSSLYFPVSPGAFQMSQLGDRNPVWSRFKGGHEMDYSTYYGGSASEGAAFDIHVYEGNVFIVGFTDAPDLEILEVEGASNDNSISSYLDAFLALFNNLGHLEWSRYIGGTGNSERARSVFADSDGIWVCGQTDGMPGFPFLNPSNGAYYNDNAEGLIDAFIMKFAANLSLEWSTRYGGSGVDEAVQILRDVNGRIWVAGATTSANLLTSAISGLVSPNSDLNGSSDDFILRFDSNGSIEWSSYIGGEDDEQNMVTNSTKISIAPNSNVYFCGSTKSSDLPEIFDNAIWDNDIYAGATDGFVVQFDYNSMGVNWATYIGTSSVENIYGCYTNIDNSLYIVGNSDGSEFTVLNPMDELYEQTATPIGNGWSTSDAFIAMYSPEHALDWFTYFGGTSFHHGEMPHDLCINNGELYIVGATDQEYLNMFGDGDVSIPLVDFGGGAYFDEFYNGEYEDAFICMFNIDLITEIKESNLITQEHILNVYPVPTLNSIKVSLNSNIDSPSHCIVRDISGKILYIHKWNAGDMETEIDLNKFPLGVYQLEVFQQNIRIGIVKCIRQ